MYIHVHVQNKILNGSSRVHIYMELLTLVTGPELPQ